MLKAYIKYAYLKAKTIKKYSELSTGYNHLQTLVLLYIFPRIIFVAQHSRIYAITRLYYKNEKFIFWKKTKTNLLV